MQNLIAQPHEQLKLQVPAISCFTTDPEPILYTVHEKTPTNLELQANHFPPTNQPSAPISIVLDEPSKPLSLTLLTPNLLLALQDGTLISIDPYQHEPPTIIGNVSHPEPERSGLLAVSPSPDATLVGLISPHSISLLDADWNLLREIPLSRDLPPPTTATLAWRADGAVMAASCLFEDDNIPTFMTIIDANATVHDISQPPLVCDPTLAWMPRYGGMLAIPTAKQNETSKFIQFYERNGLSHARSDFSLPSYVENVTMMQWSADASHLAIVTTSKDDQQDGNSLLIYSRTNYHWTCKRAVSLNSKAYGIYWDEDEPLLLRIVMPNGLVSLPHHIVPSTIISLKSCAIAAVMNGNQIALTNLSVAPVPPPMAHGILTFSSPVESIAGLAGTDLIVVLLTNASVHLLRMANPPTRVKVPPVVAVTETVGTWKLEDSTNEFGFSISRWPVLISDQLLLVVSRCNETSTKEQDESCKGLSDEIRLYRLSNDNGNAPCISTTHCRSTISAILQSRKSPWSCLCITKEGKLLRVVANTSGSLTDQWISFPAQKGRIHIDLQETNTLADFRTKSGETLTFFHSRGSELHVMDISSNRHLLLSRDCTSFYIHDDGFLCFTTRSHILYCFYLHSTADASYKGKKGTEEKNEPAPSLYDIMFADTLSDNIVEIEELDENRGALRPIDRGSHLIATVPNDVSIVLQAPRGNLETVALRPIVFEAVDSLSKLKEYSKAFSLCRRQRVDMNHIVDADVDQFLENISSFISQINKPSHLSIFLTFLKGDEHRINSVCDVFVNTLKKRDDFERFVSVVLTSLIRRVPSDLAQALSFVNEERIRNEESAVAAIDYLFVLMKNEETVYNEALGTYNLTLARFVAESSQLDPADYAEELRSYKNMKDDQYKYAIDMKLERYDKALEHLYNQGLEKYSACVSHCNEYELHVNGLKLFKTESIYRQQLLKGYAYNLQSKGNFNEAAVVHVHLQQWKDASICYSQCDHWRLAITAAAQCKSISEDERQELYETIVEDLLEKGNAIDAARIRISLLADVESGMEALINAEKWEEAFESVVIANSTTCISNDERNVIDINTTECKEAIIEGYNILLSTLEENVSKLGERRNRLETVRETKRLLRENEEQKGRVHDEAGSDIFSATTASSLVSNLSDVTFTMKQSTTSIYSTATQVGPLSSAKLDKIAEKRRRKHAKKRIKQGHPQEEEYLVGYLKKMCVGQFVMDRVKTLAVVLLFLNKIHLVAELYNKMDKFVEESLKLPEDVITEEDRHILREGKWKVAEQVVEVLVTGNEIDT